MSLFWFWEYRRTIDLTLCAILLSVIVLFQLYIWVNDTIDWVRWKWSCFRRWLKERKSKRAGMDGQR